MIIAFHSNQIAERGTETAIIDYALANEEFLHNVSIIAFPAYKVANKERYLYVKSNFKTIEYSAENNLHALLIENNVDLLYAICDGESEPDIIDMLPVQRSYKTFVHAVFSTRRKHGDFYCPIHCFLNQAYHTKYPVLPHIVKKMSFTDDNLRQELGIPNSAIVFGSYGGNNAFNIPFAQEAVIQTAKHNYEVFFIFMNITPFCTTDLRNVIFLPGTTDFLYKEKFINTTNAMIHARADGETFGLAVGEFSVKNKPIITYKPDILHKLKERILCFSGRRIGYASAHLQNLGKMAITYKNRKELSLILQSFPAVKDQKMSTIDYDCFSKKFSPENVIHIFDKIVNEKD